MLPKEILEKEAENSIKWIKEYVQKTGAKGVVLGNSGGKDSATVLAMAVKALGKENVLAVSMPCHSVEGDLDDAKLVAKAFDVKLLIVDLSDTYDKMEEELNKKLENIELSKESKINIKPRLRMTTLYGIAQTLGHLVIGTGNLCEAMVGYTTKWGDSSYDFNPIANFTVEEVLAIGKYLGVPDKILIKAPNDGLGGQSDEEKMGIKYSQISEMIEKGKVEKTCSPNENAKDIENKILKKYQASMHKRNPVPVYKFERKNHLFDRKIKCFKV